MIRPSGQRQIRVCIPPSTSSQITQTSFPVHVCKALTQPELQANPSTAGDLKMPHHQPISRLAKAMGALALVFVPTFLHADSLGFSQTNLVSDVPGLAANTDPNLKNPWGVSFSATSPFWTSDQVTGLATLYNAAGTPQSLVVTIPPGATPPSGPTGTVFSGLAAGQFPVNGAPATFIFNTLNGTLLGWNGGTTATVEATTPGAIYTGLASASAGGSNFLYAANSAPGGHINVFNSAWAPTTLSGNFTDPNLPAGLVPFNIQNISGNLYVTYASLGPGGTPMPGGIVSEFDANGNFIKRIATGGSLFAPWGIVLAPSSFGSFSNDLLIGNFGNGEILAYDATTDMFLGTINGSNGQPLVNDFLWSLETRANVNGFDPNAVYFSAGINNQADGLFGKIDAITPEPATIFGTATGLIALALLGIKRTPRSSRV
jgi:uncharacterized protein (TIGR03118 family)